MSAIPLVNLSPQGTATDAGSVMLNTGQGSTTGSFDNLVSQAGITQAAEPQVVQATGTKQQDTSEFADLLQILNMLFGQKEDLATAGENTQVQAQSRTVQAIGANSDANDSQKAFEGFFSELQNMLTMFYSLIQGLSGSGNDQGVNQNVQETAVSTSNTTGNQVAIEQPVPVSRTVSETGGGVSIAPGITLDTQQEETSQNSTGNNNIDGASLVAASAETTGQNLEAQNINSQSFTSQTQTVGDKQIEFFSLSYTVGSSDNDGSSLSLRDGQMANSLMDESAASMPSSLSQSTGNLVHLDVKKAVITSRNSGSDIETEIDMLTGSLRDGRDANGDGKSFHFEKLHISTNKNGLEAYSLQTVSDTVQGQNLNQQNGTTTGQNNAAINYAVAGPSGGMDMASNSMNQDDSNNQDATNNIYQTGAHTSATSAAEQTGNFVKIDEALGKSVAQQLADGISQAVKMNKNRAVLHLQPPELGSVRVNITVSHNNHVQANFITDHPETRHILEANMQHLKDNLAQNGFSLGQVNVDVGGNTFANSGNNPQNHQLTPFGDPRMWLGDDYQEGVDTSAAQSATISSSDGVHVII